MLGARPKTPPSGSTVWRSSIKLHQDQPVLEQANGWGLGSGWLDLRVAVMLKLEVRRQAKLYPVRSRARRGRKATLREAK